MKYFFIILFISAGITLNAQQQAESINSLFENAKDIEANSEQKDSTSNDKNIPEKLIKKENFSLGMNVNLTFGYSPGWKYFPWEAEDIGYSNFEDSSLMAMSSKITMDAQFAENFRFFQSYTVSYPEFNPKVSEIFADYNINNLVYLRIGRQNLTWGISRYYPFTNLPARLPDNFGINNSDSIDDNDSFAIKMDIPIGIGGFQGLLYTRNGYFSNQDYPALDEIAYGAYYNLASKQADTTIGVFYQKDLNIRGFTSISTTLFDKLELYTEGLISYDQENNDKLPLPFDALDGAVPKDDPDRLDFGANIGFLIGFLSDKLQLSGEYYYNGEETELDPLGAQFPLFWGHNISGGITLKLNKNRIKSYSLFKYNFNENSGIFIPSLSMEVFQNMKLNIAVPVIFGAKNAGYFQNNPDPYNRQFSLILTIQINGKI